MHDGDAVIYPPMIPRDGADTLVPTLALRLLSLHPSDVDFSVSKKPMARVTPTLKDLTNTAC